MPPILHGKDLLKFKSYWSSSSNNTLALTSNANCGFKIPSVNIVPCCSSLNESESVSLNWVKMAAWYADAVRMYFCGR